MTASGDLPHTPIAIADTHSTKTTPPPSARPLFTRVLKLGSRGSDVKALQVFLNTHGYILSAKGDGSPGHEGSVYGSLTAKAVRKFQEANPNEILTPFQLKKGTGVFGTTTKNVANRIQSQGR